MKCPKCGYLGFEHVSRCRNCGYEFSLARPSATPELPLKIDSPTPAPLEDLSVLDAAMPVMPSRLAGDTGLEPDRLVGTPSRDASPSMELPLFGASLTDDVPLITRPSPPRPPLAVRRATPDLPRLRTAQPRTQTLDLAAEPDGSNAAGSAIQALRSQPSPADGDLATDNATIAARFVAVVIDFLILLGIDLAVVYFTMQICGITLADLGLLPRGPLIAFLLVQNGGYLVAFTAGGQTLGKMAAGIKVVSTDEQSSVDFASALVRELVWVVLAVPAGLGLLTVFSRDRRGLHDRFAHTRVVRD